jgi:threonine dehydratase
VADVRVPTYDDIRAAVALVAPWVRRTPLLEVEVDGSSVTLKLELFQHSGSFKARGAFHSVLSATEQPETLVAASGGNHGLAVAHVGHRLGIPTRIFVPEAAPAVKVDAIAAL